MPLFLILQEILILYLFMVCLIFYNVSVNNLAGNHDFHLISKCWIVTKTRHRCPSQGWDLLQAIYYDYYYYYFEILILLLLLQLHYF